MASNTHWRLNLAQAVELATQEGSGDETFVDHYEGSEESAEEEDFMREVPVVDRSEESKNIFLFYPVSEVIVHHITHSKSQPTKKLHQTVRKMKIHTFQWY